MRSPYNRSDRSYPSNGDEIVAEALQDLYYGEVVVAEGRNTGDIPKGAMVVKHTPLGVYSPSPKAEGLSTDFMQHARPQRWRYCVMRSNEMSANDLILTADLLPPGRRHEMPEVSHVERGTSVVKLREALRDALNISAKKPETGEGPDLRIFEAPSVYVSALWLHDEIQEDAPQEKVDVFIDLEEKLRWPAAKFVSKVNQALAEKGPSQGRVLRKAFSTA